MRIYVAANAFRDGNGTQERPFKHINDAAKIAQPGDEVLVGPGVYREYVDPQNAGTEDARITYRSVEPLGAIITGAEVIKSWQPYEGNVWVARVANTYGVADSSTVEEITRLAQAVWNDIKELW